MKVQLKLDGQTVEPVRSLDAGDKVVHQYRCGLEAVGTKTGSREIAEWRWQLRNAGWQKSPTVTGFYPLYLELPCCGRLSPWLHGSRGGLDEAVFPPAAWTQWTQARVTEAGDWTLLPVGSAHGRSSNDHLPFFVLEKMDRRGGFVIGLGWSGDWNVSLRRSGEVCTLSGGMTHLGLQLEPGETFLQPTVLIGTYRGDASAGQRLLRRYLRDYVQPKLDGQPMRPVSFWDNYYGDYGAFTEKDFLTEIPLVAAAGFDYMVLDGGWTGGGQDAQFHSLLPHIGSWRPDPGRFQSGFVPIRAQAARHRLKMGLWFDVEHAHPSSIGFREHPELFADVPDQFGCRLLRLDRTEALDWAFENIARNIRELDARWIRMDFNANPAQSWATTDTPERRGATECRYVENLYKLYEKVLAAFPATVLENCASGGRRIDLETTRRSHTDWISDHSSNEAVIRYHLHGAGRWLPATRLNTSMAHAFLERHRPVDWKEALPASAYLSHFGGNFSVSDRLKPMRPAARAKLKRYLTLFKQTAACFAGDVYPLGEPTALYDGPAGLAAIDATGERRAVLLFGGKAADARRLVPPGFGSLLRRPPLIHDAGTAQFIGCSLWADAPRSPDQ